MLSTGRFEYSHHVLCETVWVLERFDKMCGRYLDERCCRLKKVKTGSSNGLLLLCEPGQAVHSGMTSQYPFLQLSCFLWLLKLDQRAFISRQWLNINMNHFNTIFMHCLSRGNSKSCHFYRSAPNAFPLTPWSEIKEKAKKCIVVQMRLLIFSLHTRTPCCVIQTSEGALDKAG